MNPRLTRWSSLPLAATLTTAPLWVALIERQVGSNSPVAASSKALMATAPIATTPTLVALQQWFSNGWFDEVIGGATRAIGSQGKPNPRYFYYRGRSFYDIGSFRRAEEDLKPLGDFKPFSTWTSASSYVKKMRVWRDFAPPNLREIREANGSTRFRVYYGEDGEWTRAAIRALQEAHTANLKMLGFARLDTPVLLFDDRHKFDAFESAISGKTGPTWVDGKGDSRGFRIYRVLPKARRLSRGEIKVLRSIVAHEYHHSIVGRFVGNGILPKWLTEGLAECASDLVVPGRRAQEEAAFGRTWKKGRVLGFNEITGREGFRDAVNERNAPLKKGEIRKRYADPYGQAHHMAAYFLSRLQPGGLQKFLVTLRAKRQFEEVFQKHLRRSPREFYDAWFKHCRTLYGEPVAPKAPVVPAAPTP